MPADEAKPRNLGAMTAQAVRMLRLSHATVEHAPAMVLWLDADGRIRRANALATSLLRRPLPMLAGRRLDELVADGQPSLWSRLRDVTTDASVTVLACPLRVEGTKAGEAPDLPVDVAASQVAFEEERFFCLFMTDARARLQAEAELRQALDEVERYKAQLEAENVYLQDEIKLSHGFGAIVGESAVLREVLTRVEQVASSTATVLILGESGTGKELIARAVHDHSERRPRPLVKVNCAALPASLIESELFGHEKGAFTGALSRRIGRFELADGGTIFLDEIGDLPLALQAKLLRVLQEGEFERLGDPKTHTVDVRVIAATNRNLLTAVEAGEFRADLYYRLNVFPIELPPLRARRDDVPLLAEHFVNKYAGRMGRALRGLSPRMRASLTAYDWPGNVRELENVIERAVILHRGPGGALDEPLAVPASTGTTASVARAVAPGASAAAPGVEGGPVVEMPTLGRATLPEMEAQMIRDALTACGWVIAGKKGAARKLDIAPSTLRERMRKYGIERPA